jgi:hypothetical protein
MVLFIYGYKMRHQWSIRIGSIMTLIGIILNRLNVSVIAFKWYAPNHYYPSWHEIVITLMVVLTEIWIFRFIARRMAVFHDHKKVEATPISKAA